MAEIKKTVSAKCFIQVFDNEQGILYCPGDIEESLDLDTDAALCFELTPVDRKYAMDSQVRRVDARKKEIVAMKKEGFENLYQYRSYKKLNGEAEAAQA